MLRLAAVALLAVMLASCGADPDRPTATRVITQTIAAPPRGAVAQVAPAVTPSEGPTRDYEVGETLPQVSLQVAADGCGVIRGQFAGNPPHGLQWSFTDPQGFEVLGRNALGETAYRYFGGGNYSVVLKAWGGESYVPVSNAVSVAC